MSHTPYVETLVNSYTTGEQSESLVAALADGGWVANWQSFGQDGDGFGIYQQAYNADGTVLGEETQVNLYTTGNQSPASITALDDGGWVVTWKSTDQDGDNDGVFQQAYNADGTALGGETQVNSYTTGQQLSQWSSQWTTALDGGGWVVAWESSDQDGDSFGVYQQAYQADGTPMGGETLVNTYTTSDQLSNSIATLADGGWVVTWQSFGQDGSRNGIYQQAYHADGTTMGDETRVNTYTTSDQDLSKVVGLADGGWVVTWESDQDGGGSGIYQQAYSADGTALGSETQVNTYTTGNQSPGSITALTNGGWVVTWTSPGQDGDNSGIFQQAYNADGTTLGSETQVNTYAASLQLLGNVVALADGGWVAVYSSIGPDGSSSGIFQQAYNADGTANGGETLVNTFTTNAQTSPKAAALADGGWIVTWTSQSQDGDSYGIYQERFDADGHVPGSNYAPTAADNTVSLLKNGGYGFSQKIFGFSDGTDGDSFASVVITALPSAGKLMLDGAAVTAGQVIAVDDLKGLVWQASKHALAATLNFQVVDDGGTEAHGNNTSAVHTLTFAIESDTFTGTNAADKLAGTDGHDILIGRRGADRLTGGAGPDTFVFRTGDGKDTITDFQSVQGDKIDLSAVDAITSYKDLTRHHLSIQSADLWITDGDSDTIVLRNTSTADLHKGDFVF